MLLLLKAENEERCDTGNIRFEKSIMEMPEKILKIIQNKCCQVLTAIVSSFNLFTLVCKGLLTVFSVAAQLVTPSPSGNSSFSCFNPQ